MPEISPLASYPPVDIPDMTDVMAKRAQADTYTLNVAEKARNYNALKQYGEDAARGDPEALIQLNSKNPEAGNALANIRHSTALSLQQEQTTRRQMLAAAAQQMSQMSDPSQRMAVGMDTISRLEQENKMHPDEAQHYRDLFKNDPRALDAVMYQNLDTKDVPEMVGRTALAGVPAFGIKHGIERSMAPPVAIPYNDPSQVGGKGYENVPGNRLPGAWTPQSVQPLPPMFGPVSTGTGAEPPSSGGLPGVARGPLSPADYNPNAAPGAVRTSGLVTTPSTYIPSSSDGAIPSIPAPPDEYKGMIADAASKYNVPEELLTRVLHGESGYNANNIGPMTRYGTAKGIGQFIDSTAAARGIKNPFDPKEAIPASAAYLAELHDKTGSWQGAIKGYLGGTPNIRDHRTYFTSGIVQTARQLDSKGAAPPAPGSTAPTGTTLAPRATMPMPGAATATSTAPAPEPPPTAPGGAPSSATGGTGAPPATRTSAPGAVQPPPITSPGARSEPATPPGRTQRANDPFGLYVGDSITGQQINHGANGTLDAPNHGQPIKPGLTAGVGDTPTRVRDRIDTLDKVPESVFLSSGATNDPTQIDAVAESVGKLIDKGAKYVVVPGVGPGVENSEMINSLLKESVEKEGGICFDPQVKWINNSQERGIHPAEVDKVQQQAAQALARAKASEIVPSEQRRSDAEDQPTGQIEKPQDTVEYPPRDGSPIRPVSLTSGDQESPMQLSATSGSGGGTPTQLAVGGPDVVVGEKGALGLPIAQQPLTQQPLTAQSQDQPKSRFGGYPAFNPAVPEELSKNQDMTRKEAEEYQKVATAANNGMVSIYKLRSILDGGYVTGMTAAKREAISNAVSTFSNIFGKTSNVTDRETAMYNFFNSVSKNLAFDMVTALGSREAQQIVAQVMDIKPSVFHTVAGNRAILASLEQAFQMQLDKQKFYADRLSNPTAETYGKLGASEEFHKQNPWQVYASKAMPLKIPVDKDGNLRTKEMFTGAYYDLSNLSDSERNIKHKEGDRGIWNGTGIKPAGRVPWMKE